MNTKKLFSVFLSIVMVLCMMPSLAFAAEDTGGIPSGEVSSEEVTDKDTTTEDAANKDTTGEDVSKDNTSKGETTDEDTTSEWTSEDFTYNNEYSQRIYGCDYSRDITISGTVISGFSEDGLKKLENNKNLVIPRTDADGNILVGIGQKAFYKKGLNSVEFPSGMLVPYDDTLTHSVTKRGNFIIAENAFSGNNLTSVDLPIGVIAVMSSAFNNNKLESVSFPKTIWWIETQSFAKNRISEVEFPRTCDFQLEMHGMTFANNKIKSVRLPDHTAVVSKDAFFLNIGMEPVDSKTPDRQKTYKDIDGNKQNTGIVYMNSDNPEHANMDRISHDGKQTDAQHSYFQRLIINGEGSSTPGTGDGEGSEGGEGSGGNPGSGEGSGEEETGKWDISDFTFTEDGTGITGLSESGIAKRATQRVLVLPEKSANGEYITKIEAAQPGRNGLFASETEKFTKVLLPSKLESIGAFAFQNNDIQKCDFPNTLTSIGNGAFQTNKLENIILPDSVTSLGNGVFATNPTIKAVSLSSGLNKIPDSAFGCSDAKNYMTNFTEIEIPVGITSIGRNAFAGNNFHSIDIPSTVTSIGNYAFSTKKNLKDPCKLTLHKGLQTMGTNTFRNKAIATVVLPESVTKIGKDSFSKEFEGALVTKILYTKESQCDNVKNFPVNISTHEYIYVDLSKWNASDFEIENSVIKGLSSEGENKLLTTKTLAIPDVDAEGNEITGIADNAFKDYGFESVTMPSAIKGIGANAFNGNKLTSIEFPESLETIGDKAFANNKLVYTQLPDGIKSVAGNCFEENRGVFGVVYLFSNKSTGINDTTYQKFVVGDMPDVNQPWENKDFTWNAQTVTGLTACGNVKRVYNKNLVIPETTPDGKPVLNIGNDAFSVPDSATVVTKFGIDSPEGFKSVDMPKSVETIGDNAFKQNAITDIDLGKATSLGVHAFHGNKLEKAIIPDTVTSIGDGCFATNSITEIKLSKNITVIPGGCFSMNIRLDHVDIPEGVTEIQQTAFAGARLTELKIPSTVTKIGKKAFHLHHITNLVIPGNVKVIEESAFEGTYKATTLKTLVLSEGIEKIGKFAFKEALLEEVKLPYSLKTLGFEPFRNNAGANGSHVVILKTNNRDHLKFADGESYEINYVEPPVVVVPPKDPITNPKDDNGNTSTNVDLSNKVNADNGKADVKLDKDFADKVVENATNNKSESVDLDAGTTAGNTTKTELTLPKDTYKDIAGKTDAKKVTVKTDSATISMDKDTVIAITEQAGSAEEVKLVIETKETSEDKVVVELKLVTSNGTIHDFKGGKVTVTVPVKNTSGKKLVAVYIDNNGKYTIIGGALTADKKAFVFETGHFSQYAVMTEEAADEVIKAQEPEKPAKPVVKSVALTSVKAQKKAMKVTWKKSADKVNGYQVRYSTSKSFKTCKTVSVKYTKKVNSRTVKKLKSGKRYYVKVRTYVKNSDGTYYSKWSKVKSVKVK